MRSNAGPIMKKKLLLLACALIAVQVDAATNINSTNAYSWGSNIGWINWRGDVANGGIIGEDVLGGYIYGANVGWINLGSYNPANHLKYQNNSATDFGVNLIKLDSNTAALRGFAYGANIGWVNFEAMGDPRVDLTTRQLHGYAYGANVGWINLGELGITLQSDNIAPGVDTDGNGIPDWFEQTYFGQLGVDPNADPDADGLTTFQEYQKGSDPTFPDERLLNISTRLPVQTGENVLIAGFIITGNTPKRVIVIGLGPSLTALGVAGAMENPTLELHQGDSLLASNDNWKDSQGNEIQLTGLAPANDSESAIVRVLNPGAYTAILAGKDGGTGVGVVEAFDLDQSVASRLANISTRGFVGTDDNVLIGGFIVGPEAGGTPRVIVAALGPSLTAAGVSGAVDDTTLELRDSNGNVIALNDDWKQSQQAEIEATGLIPSDDRESAVVIRLTPGNYTGIVRGKDNSVGVGLVEVFNIP
jgi:hypothetical protein